MQTVLITLVGSKQSIDLEVPGEVPVIDLIPPLVILSESVVVSQADILLWGLGRAEDTAPLDMRQSLISSGIVDGTKLTVKTRAAWMQQRMLQPKTSRPRPILPDSNSGGIGVTWSNEELLP